LTTLPLVFSEKPYSLSDSIIGVTFLPVGIAMLLGFHQKKKKLIKNKRKQKYFTYLIFFNILFILKLLFFRG
jgi:Ca2+/H+ antiporter